MQLESWVFQPQPLPFGQVAFHGIHHAAVHLHVVNGLDIRVQECLGQSADSLADQQYSLRVRVLRDDSRGQDLLPLRVGECRRQLTIEVEVELPGHAANGDILVSGFAAFHEPGGGKSMPAGGHCRLFKGLPRRQQADHGQHNGQRSGGNQPMSVGAHAQDHGRGPHNGQGREKDGK